MEVQAHTTPNSRKELRHYLRQRRLTTSIHQTITMQALNDLEEALHLLAGAGRPTPEWQEAVSSYLYKRLGVHLQGQSKGKL